MTSVGGREKLCWYLNDPVTIISRFRSEDGAGYIHADMHKSDLISKVTSFE